MTKFFKFEDGISHTIYLNLEHINSARVIENKKASNFEVTITWCDGKEELLFMKNDVAKAFLTTLEKRDF